ncbi:hypothetical protein [Streptomyces sp. ADI95-16]|uniref:hypothetical protein n=1 Tax=Streptomyces sp. ADI95-16 TaxID=1522758 RepID=UPI0013DDDB2F|nr:hypothetical protein [Streptomyces sp. ADI95-16]
MTKLASRVADVLARAELGLEVEVVESSRTVSMTRFFSFSMMTIPLRERCAERNSAVLPKGGFSKTFEQLSLLSGSF